MTTYTFDGRQVIVRGDNKVKPVLILFHGAGGSASIFEQHLSLSVTSRFLVYMSALGEPATWRTKDGLRDEVRYINMVMDNLKVNHNFDMLDITCLGHSNGGMMACAYADKNPNVNKIVIVNSTINAEYTSFDGVVRHIHSKDDELVPYDGGTYNSVGQTRNIFNKAGADYKHLEVTGDHSLASVKQALIDDWGTSLDAIIGL